MNIWKKIAEAIIVEIGKAQATLENGTQPIDIYHAQGALAALKWVLRLPEHLKAEMKPQGETNIDEL